MSEASAAGWSRLPVGQYVPAAAAAGNADAQGKCDFPLTLYARPSDCHVMSCGLCEFARGCMIHEILE